MISRKVMLLGEIGVGKTSIAQRLVFQRFAFDYKPTIGVDVYRYDVPPAAGREGVTLIVWDTDGNLGESIFRHVYMKEAAAAMIVGDVTRRHTLDTMVKLGELFREAFPGRYHAYILNKSDLVAVPGAIEIPEALEKTGADIARTSAKTGENVEAVFLKAAEAILRRGL